MATQKVTPFPSPQQEPQIPEGISQAEIDRLLTNRNKLRQLKELVETHEQFKDPLPEDKASVKRWVGHLMQREKTLLHELKPVSIQIYGDVAVVLYYYAEVVKDAEGKETTRSGRWTDVWLKQGDGWVAIGWHGGQTSGD